MPDAQRSNEAEVGIALQTGEGSGAANPTHAHPLYSGLPRPVETIKEADVSDTSALVAAIYKTEQHWEMPLVFPGLPDSLGYYLKAILPNLITTGVTDKVHTFTLGTGAPPFVTMFGRIGSTYRKFVDGRCSELAVNFEAGEVLRIGATMSGYTPSDLAAAYTAANTEVFSSAGPFLTFIGGTFQFDEDSTTPATRANIASGTTTLSREITLTQTDGLNPEFFGVGRFRTGMSLDVIWVNYEAFKATYYGSITGTASSASPVFGSADLTFQVGPAALANKKLQIQLRNIALRVPDPPDVDPGAGPLHMSIAGMSAKSGSTELVTATLSNTIASY